MQRHFRAVRPYNVDGAPHEDSAPSDSRSGSSRQKVSHDKEFGQNSPPCIRRNRDRSRTPGSLGQTRSRALRNHDERPIAARIEVVSPEFRIVSDICRTSEEKWKVPLTNPQYREESVEELERP
jgi:hypothetical protein